jgi:carbon-monoxide dehydrogenase large subunit
VGTRTEEETSRMSDLTGTERFAIGQGVRRLEDARLVRGRGRYTSDLALSGQVEAVVVRSPHAHARIRAIDTSAARSEPGVLAVVTAGDVERAGLGPLPSDRTRKRADGSPALATPRHVLARDRVRHVGDPVAMVVAETYGQAVDAAERVMVDYEPLPVVASAVTATHPGAARVWDEAPDNIAFVWSAGDREAVDRAFAAAAHVTQLALVVSRVGPSPIEPRAAVGQHDPATDRYTLVTCIQGPHQTRAALAEHVLGIPPERLRVVTPDVGGSFGMKSGVYPELALVLWAARVVGRPVRWVSGRGEGFLSDDQGRDCASTVELALDAGGRFLALRVRTDVNAGAYLTPRSSAPTNNVGGLAGVYRTPAIHVEIRGVFTNTTPTGPYRGAGRPEATCAIERIIDVAARELGIDRVELRRRNMIPASAMPFRTGLVFTYDCGDFERNMDRALAVADQAAFEARRAGARRRGKLRGLGLANPIEVAGGPFLRPMLDRAEISLDAGGGVTLVSGSTSMGQGHETAFVQLVSERLGVAPGNIRLVLGDTDAIAAGRGNGGSSALSVGGAAVVTAADRVIAKGTQIAAHLLEAAAGDVVFGGGRFSVVGTDRGVGIADVARAAHGTDVLPPGLEPGLTGAAEWVPASVNFPNGCHVCEVEIDEETGAVRVVRYVVVDDVGRVVNPLLLKGQIHGGVAQGLGQALVEAIVHDPVTGQLLSGSFMEYGLPRADDLPFLEMESHEVPTATNPLGVKGAGEAGTVGALPAVMNAVNDALAPLGVRHLDMPATPARVWAAIREARRRSG